jgi:general secretion pathway protein G
MIIQNITPRLRPQGFTLMEMILVLAIIGLLVGLGVSKMVGVTNGAKITRAEADISSMSTNLLRYETANGRLPTQEQGLEALVNRPVNGPAPKRWSQIMQPSALNDPWENPYQYRNPGKKNTSGYDVFSMGPDGQPETADDIGNWE